MLKQERVNNKKREPLYGSLDLTGTETLRADVELAGLPAAYIHPYILNVNQPTTSRMTIRMADRISRSRSTTAAITELGQSYSLLYLGTVN